MKRVIKRVFPIILCLVLMFCLFATPLTVPKADAIAITASGVTIAVISSLLAALGISFASVDATQQASQGFYASMTDGSSAKEFIDNLVSLNANPPPEYNGSGEQFNKVLLNIANNAGLVSFVEAAKGFFGVDGDVAIPSNSGVCNVPDITYFRISNVKVNNLNVTSQSTSNFNSFFWYPSNFVFAPYSENLEFQYNGHNYSCRTSSYDVYSAGYLQPVVIFEVDGNVSILPISSSDVSKFGHDVRFGFCNVINGNTSYACLYGLYKRIDSNGNTYINSALAYSVPNQFSFVINDSDVKPNYDEIPYTNTTEFPWQNIIELISDYTSQGKEVTFDYTETLNAIQNQNQELLQNQRELLQQNADILAELEKLNNPTTDPGTDPETKPEGEGEGDLNVPKLPSLADKFPFCVPFDLIHLIQNLNATPKAPHWEIPFGFGLEEPYVIDIDFSDFEVLAAPIRWFCVIAFILGLILITRKIIQG